MFQFIFNRLTAKEKPKAAKPRDLKDSSGRVFARLVTTGKTPRIEFLAGASPDAVEKAADLVASHFAGFAAKP